MRQCEVCVREYKDAVMQLGAISSKVAKDDWLLAWTIADRARLKSVEMFGQLKAHSKEHGC